MLCPSQTFQPSHGRWLPVLYKSPTGHLRGSLIEYDNEGFAKFKVVDQPSVVWVEINLYGVPSWEKERHLKDIREKNAGTLERPHDEVFSWINFSTNQAFYIMKFDSMRRP